MMLGEAGKFKEMLFEGLKRKFGGKLTDEELNEMFKSVSLSNESPPFVKRTALCPYLFRYFRSR